MVRNLVLTAIIAMGIIYIFFIPADPVGFKILMKLIPMALIILFALQQDLYFPVHTNGLSSMVYSFA